MIGMACLTAVINVIQSHSLIDSQLAVNFHDAWFLLLLSIGPALHLENEKKEKQTMRKEGKGHAVIILSSSPTFKFFFFFLRIIILIYLFLTSSRYRRKTASRLSFRRVSNMTSEVSIVVRFACLFLFLYFIFS